MGQCASNKAKGNLSVKKIVSHKNPGRKSGKMQKHKPVTVPKDEERKLHEGDRAPQKKPQKYTKGVAMSFGFKRRPTPMTSNSGTVAWDSTTLKPDPNGNKNESKDRTVHKSIESSQKPPSSITPRPSRFNFTPNPTERTNKVADIATHQSAQFGTSRTSPSHENTRNVTIVTRTEITEKAEVGSKDRGAAQSGGKFTFQTTRLPQPEPIRVIETKTAKTIANNNRKSARMWRQYEEKKIGTSNEDSGFGSIASGGPGENDYSLLSNKSNSERRFEEDPIRQRLHGCNKRPSLLEMSDSLSDACTPPPLPELPSVFSFGKHMDSNKEQEYKNCFSKDEYNACRKMFLKSTTPTSFLKSRVRNLFDRDSSQSSSDQEWVNGGEAMADDVSLSLSPTLKSKEPTPKRYSAVKTESMLQSLKPSLSLEMIDSLKESMSLSLADEDPNFSAVAANNHSAALLDDEILSPVESLLSSSDTEELVKKKPSVSSSNSKDINEKLTPSSPDSPNDTCSLSLSEDKDDYLIDDEIADQPELTSGHLFLNDTLDKADSSPRRVSYSQDFSPLPLRKTSDLLSHAKQGSLDSLSPCDSIASEDLMMDYDASHSEMWDGQSASLPSLESMPKSKMKLDDYFYNNKNLLKSPTPKNSLTNGISPAHLFNSPNALKSRLSHRSSPECRSPRRYHFGYPEPHAETLTMTRANHSAAQQDIIGIKTMLLTLKRVLNESETHYPLKSTSDGSYYNDNNCQNNNNNNNNGEFKLELADLRRQVLFLQGQLEDKEKTVSDLQKQIDYLAIQNARDCVEEPRSLPADIDNRCNAATQTERARPLSTGVFSVTSSPIDDNNPILRLMIK